VDPVIFPELEAPYPTIHEPVSEEIPSVPGDVLPRFSHVPPSTRQSKDRWPLSPEMQAFPVLGTPLLSDVLIWITPFLTLPEQNRLKTVARDYQYGPEFGPLYGSTAPGRHTADDAGVLAYQTGPEP
jgi:hypothetical protein